MNSIVLGNRVPYEYFVTKGRGESDAGSQGLKYETGSYDQALTEAGIENCNIVEYTSVIPTVAKEISREEGLRRLQWGEVLECIKAQTNGAKGSFISSAVMTIYVYDRNRQWLGGFAVEYSNTMKQKSSEEEEKKRIETSLSESIKELIERRGLGKINGLLRLYQDNVTDKGFIIHPGKDFVYSTLNVKKKHGTVLSSLCFVSYQVPVLGKQRERKRKTVKKR
jgi:pyruvoyl-dependent arginine decarboxylase